MLSTTQVLAATDVTPRLREAMLELMQTYYENISADQFVADLQEKQWVIVLRDSNGALCGFSTQRLIERDVDGRSITALFSGDTIVAREHWGDSALAQAWGRFALQLIDDRPGMELYWFLLSKGFRTYRYLPLFFHEFDPSPDRQMPIRAARVIDALAAGRFGHSYDAVTKTIKANGTKDRLRPGVAEITSARLRDPYIRYFVKRNPNHARGSELCCLAPLTRQNFTRAAWRVIQPEEATV